MYHSADFTAIFNSHMKHFTYVDTISLGQRIIPIGNNEYREKKNNTRVILLDNT